MRICFFDWVNRGHHALYLRRFVEAFQGQADVLVAAPDEALEQLRDLSIQEVHLGSPRPTIRDWRPLDRERQRVLEREALLLERVARVAGPTQLVHLYADQVLPVLVRRPRLHVPLSVLLFYPRAHYPTAFGTRLAPLELSRAWARELLIAAWRRRPDAHALFTLDEEAARRWGARRGAPAFWIPEPPVKMPAKQVPPDQRVGCVLYGALADRKGIHLLVRAITSKPLHISITIAGEASPSFLPTLDDYAAGMRNNGATVHLCPYRHTEMEGLDVLARAKCVVLPYPKHDGMSRVLLEACAVGTPVVVHDRGLLGYLVRQHKLGHAVDCTDPRALRCAIVDLTFSERWDAYADHLAEFASRFAVRRFREAVHAPFAQRLEHPYSPTPALGPGNA